MRMHLVVIGEPARQVLEHGVRIGRWIDAHVICPRLDLI